MSVFFCSWYLLGWNSMSQSFSHAWRRSRSSWRWDASSRLLIDLYTTQSSANSRADKLFFPSPVNRNRISPMTLPWGIPDYTCAVWDLPFSMTTCCVRLSSCGDYLVFHNVPCACVIMSVMRFASSNSLWYRPGSVNFTRSTQKKQKG